MRPFLLLTLAFSVASNAFAETPKEKWEGYRAVEDLRELNLPFQEFAENAVLDMETVGTTKTPNEKFDIVDLQSDSRAKKIITDKKTLNNDGFFFQIETCRKQNLRYCPTLGYSSSGTLFFNNGKYYTCRHGFHNWLSLASTLNNNISVEKLSPPIIVRTRKGKIIYNSAYSNQNQFKFSFINTNQKYNNQYQNNNVILLNIDFVQMTLDGKQLAKDYKLKALPAESVNAFIGLETYMFGYPAKTEIFKNKEGDAPGFQLFATHGFVFDFDSERNDFDTTNFGSKGMSGGPVVSASGTLLGMTCSGGNSQIADLYPNSVTSNFMPLDKEFILNAWESLIVPKQASLMNN